MSIGLDSISGDPVSGTGAPTPPTFIFVWLAIVVKLVDQKWPDEAKPKVFA